MTRDQITEGLSLLILRLANPALYTTVADIPPGYRPEEWAYIKGIASGEIMRLRDRLVALRSAVNRDPGADIPLQWGE